jgi:hypothetical protein
MSFLNAHVLLEDDEMTKDSTLSVYFYLSLDSAILHYPAINKKKRGSIMIYEATTKL